jgi:hypothetical protein
MPAPGQPVSAAWAREVAEAINRSRATGGPGILVSEGTAGTTITAVAAMAGNRRAESGGGAVPCRIDNAGADVANLGGTRVTVYADGIHAPATGSGTLFFLEAAYGFAPEGAWVLGFPGATLVLGGSEGAS